MWTGHDDQHDPMARFNGAQGRTLFVEQECGHRNRKLSQNALRAVFHSLFLNQSKHGQCQRFDRTDRAPSFTARAGDMTVFTP
ncbi:MAG TPA: hypothetical protein DDW98_11275, partial [Gammaproteobacteria bacterium]|nr:hypothetical protein [Gammaproteobacteria bacterium]